MVVRDCVRCETAQYTVTVVHGAVCMTAKLNGTPKTTEQNRIVRTGKPDEAEVNNDKKTVLEVLYC